jgi:hypothetical protein
MLAVEITSIVTNYMTGTIHPDKTAQRAKQKG